MAVDIKQYIENPCKTLSVPYWKDKCTVIPNNIQIVHDNYFEGDKYIAYQDCKFFRIKHDLKNVIKTDLPENLTFINASLMDYYNHINDCYDDICITKEEISKYNEKSVYDNDLWIALYNKDTDSIIATGIADFDKEIREGILEWIQVTKEYRRHGLGKIIVNELLWRIKQKNAFFATVSGKCNSISNPEKLYRSCGFSGNDIWHILKE